MGWVCVIHNMTITYPDIINSNFKFLIEIDDSTHLNKGDYDRRRDLHFKNQGYKTYRIIFRNVGSVIMEMKRICLHIMTSSKCTPELEGLLSAWINKYI